MSSYKFSMENKNNNNLRKPFLRSDVLSRSKINVQSASAQYNDSPPLNENLLREMAQAYAGVLSKYGYSVKPNIHNNGSTLEGSSTDKIKGQANVNIPSGVPIGTPFYDSNLDYLSSNLLPLTNSIPNEGSLQETNSLLVQILNELRTIVCLIDNNRRRRLS
ncbi:MAG: hypothetical protein PHX09_00965 [Clostridia bacterium]|nr:hypothetical protein [Clostridia bacterium]MDD4685816.1 hypothetical protein [Clostridia bacterium]